MIRKGPFKDAKDERWTPVIQELFERMARGESPKQLAKFATEAGLPKPKAGKDKKWRPTALRALIRNPIYKGVERFRKNHSVKLLSTGKHVQKRTISDEILYRNMPHLAHVDAQLWKRANDMIDGRQANPLMKPNKPDSGFDSRRIGARRLLRDKFTCNICGAQMIKTGYLRCNAYQCGAAKKSECWNKIFLRLNVVHDNILKAVVEQLKKQEGFVELIVSEAQKLNRNGGDVGTQIQRLQEELKDISQEQKRLSLAIRKGGEIDALVLPLKELDEKSKGMKDEIAYLESQRDSLCKPLTREEILNAIDSVIENIAKSEDVWSIIRPLIAEVRAVPYQRLDGGHDVARGRIRLNLLHLLPREWQELLDVNDIAAKIEAIHPEIEVDLFRRNQKELYAVKVYQYRMQKMPVAEICSRLGISRSNYDPIVSFGKLLEHSGHKEMFIELTHCPKKFMNATLPDYGKELVARDYISDSAQAKLPIKFEDKKSLACVTPEMAAEDLGGHCHIEVG